MVNLPTPKLEAWKYTHLARAVEALCAEAEGQAAPESLPLQSLLPLLQGPCFAFVNGACVAQPELPAGVTLRDNGAGFTGPSEGALDGLDALPVAQVWELNIAQSVEAPFVIVHRGHGTARLDVTLAAGCSATVIEIHVAEAGSAQWQHQACSIAVGEEASLTHSVVQLLPDAAQLIQTRRQRQTLAPKAAYKGTLATFGGGLVRSEIHTTLSEHCDYQLMSLCCPRLAQHHDVTLKTYHTGVGNTVNIRQRNLQTGQSHAVFQGKFDVAQAAQKTDAYMHCHTLLLSDEARVSTKPELEIYADDVKCSHGAACGGLNGNQLFYLRARGLTEAQARAVLVQGYADEFVQAFPEGIRPSLAARVASWLEN